MPPRSETSDTNPARMRAAGNSMVATGQPPSLTRAQCDGQHDSHAKGTTLADPRGSGQVWIRVAEELRLLRSTFLEHGQDASLDGTATVTARASYSR
jgi:hypothetical protein